MKPLPGILFAVLLTLAGASTAAPAPAATPTVTPELQRAVKLLLAGEDPQTRQAAIDYLSKMPAQALPLVTANLFPDLSKALDDLGAEDFKTRRQATEQLRRQGRAIRGQIEAREQSTADPEVRARCHELLAGFATATPTATDNRLLLDVIRIVLVSHATGETSRRFLGELKHLLEALSPEQRAQLLATHAPLPTSPALDDLLQACALAAPTLADFEPAASLLAAPNQLQLPALLGRLEELAPGRCELRRQWLTRMTAADAYAWLGSVTLDPDTIPAGLKELAAVPEPGADEDGLTTVLLASGHPVAQAIGLVRKGLFMPEGVAALAALIKPPADLFAPTPTDAERLRDIRAALQALSATLLASEDPALAYLGAIFHANRPAATAEPLQGFLLRRAAEPAAANGAAQFRLLYPEAVPALREAAVQAIRSTTQMQDAATVVNLTAVLNGLGLPGAPGEFDAWLTTTANAAEPAYKLTWAELGMALGGRGQALWPFLADAVPTGPLLARLAADGPEGCQRALQLCQRQTSAKPAADAADNPDGDTPWLPEFGPLLTAKPDTAAALVSTTFANLAKMTSAGPTPDGANTGFPSRTTLRNLMVTPEALTGENGDGIAALGLFLRGHPETAALITPHLADRSFAARLAACRILVIGYQAHPQLEATLTALLHEAPAPQTRLVIVGLMFQAGIFANPVAWDAFIDALEDPQVEDHHIGFTMDCLADDSKAAVPFLKEALERLPLPARTERALHVGAAILCSTPGDAASRTALQAIVNGPDAYYVAWTLRALAELDQAPVLDADRLLFLCRNINQPAMLTQTLLGSADNARRAGPALLATLGRHVCQDFGLGDVLRQYPEVQKALTPALVTRTHSENLPVRLLATHYLANCPTTLTALAPDLVNRLSQAPTVFDVYSQLETIGNAGTAAAGAVPEIEKRLAAAKGPLSWRCLFALARIAPEPENRRRYATRLLTEFEQASPRDRGGVIPLLGLMPEFNELTEPVLIRCLEAPVAPCDAVMDANRQEAAMTLARRVPFSKATVAAYATAIDNSVYHSGSGNQNWVMVNLAWAVRQDPKSCRELLPRFEKMRANCPLSGDMLTITRRALRQP